MANTLKAAFVNEALLGSNYFPNQRSDPNELPDTVHTKQLLPEVAAQLSNLAIRDSRKSLGYDSVSYFAHRFDGRRRHLQIPHPSAYATLCRAIHRHWKHIAHIADNESSKIRPTAHADGRLFQMSYEDWTDRTRDELEKTKGHGFQVSADIAQCFPSIYSHAIPWAAVGFDTAKGNRHQSAWFNQLDKYSRAMKRNETNGLIIRPGSSSILVEVVLSQVDYALRDQEFTFHRFLDDYTAYVPTHQKADEFVESLESELSQFHLVANRSKAKIATLPGGRVEWAITALRNALPTSSPVTRYQAMSYLDFAVGLSNSHPNVSTIKYGLKSLLEQKLEKDAYPDVFLYAATLAERQSGLVSLLERFPTEYRRSLVLSHKEDLERAIRGFASRKQSDGMLWGCHVLMSEEQSIENETARALVNSGDCLALCMVIAHGSDEQRSSAVSFLENHDRKSLYQIDRYWLLWYEAFIRDLVPNPYTDGEEAVFETLRSHDVKFFH